MNKRSIDQVDLAGKRVFIRVDFNVPLSDGRVTDDTRIRAAIPTIAYAMGAGARVIVASHLGRPKGAPDKKYSLRQILPAFEEALGAPVAFVEACCGDPVKAKIAELPAGGVLLLENIRFHKEETDNDPGFAAELAELCDVYVNDAFGTAHRAHASTEGIARLVKPAVAGKLLQAELDAFNHSLAHPQEPLAVIIGGAKVSSKLAVLENLVDKCGVMLIGGGMAFTFLAALGFEVGDNILEAEMIPAVEKILARAKERKVKIYLPVDFLVAGSIDAESAQDVVTYQDLKKGEVAPDIGPATVALFKLALKNVKTIVWNGPMGVFENAPFSAGTLAMAHAVAGSGALTVVGGGDSVAAIGLSGLAGQISHISTGGGAFLELLEGKELPGIAALTDAEPVGA